MSIPSGRKILLIGFVVVLLVAIPITVYLVQQQQQTKSGAVPATKVSFTPTNQSTTVGDNVTFDINMDPGTNLVSFVKVLITYDATKLATEGAGLVPNTIAFPSVLQQPTYEPGTISVTLSIGGSPQNVIQTPTKIGSVTFKTLAPTETAPTQITFGNQTQVLSIGSTDQFNENVLSTASPATVSITSTIPTATPTTEPTPTPTVIPTATPTLEPGVTATPTLTPTPTTAQIASSGPSCTSFTLDREATGTAPYNVNFTLIGTSANSTISNVIFNFGDEQTQTIDQSGGIGTNSVNILTSHIYDTVGTFTATATLTDAAGLTNTTQDCSIVMTINSSVTPTVAQPSPLPPTGPSSFITIGVIGAILTLIGMILLFAL